ncbi:DUF2169 domain-containing protein [Variovorax sp. CAN2819]|uniref:DUF2169 family type VI secretion system accessory protein n=1 Tax=Variovorax sp. CAN15 TaxID=3046727 RepID=UPI002648A717|nr:DUF2169 domain-containing protein [Variovorax sp. CAN15]MDN6886511.1 DUF2169 domain-containing protein [Variovorax sp. CAN15]
MKVIKPLRLSVLSRPFPWQRRQRLGLTVIAMTGTDAVPVLYPDAELWPLVAEEIGEQGVLDLGMPKRSAEFLATGHAYTAHQQTRNQCMVKMRVGTIEKSLRVSGDRYWLDRRATPPRDFESMPLDWQRAYGGASFADNPLGIGADEETINGVRTRRLPNIEAPDALIQRHDQQLTPAGFGAIDVMWPRRFARVGKDYGERWAREDFPAFSGDMDWHLFNAAPEDQWWRDTDSIPGGASYEIWNMHPGKPCQEGRLPDWRARCFLTLAGEAGETTFTDVPMRMTTAWFFPHRERIVLIYHGVADIREDDAADVLHLMPALEESAAEPLPASHYRSVMQQRLDTESGALYSFRDRDLLPAAAIAPWLDTISLKDRPLGPLASNAQRHGEWMREQMRQKMIGDGQDPDRYFPPPDPADELPTLDALPEFVARSKRLQEEARQKLQAQRQELSETLRAGAAEAGPVGPDMAPLLALAEGREPPALKGPPSAAMAPHIQSMAASISEVPGTLAAGMGPVTELLGRGEFITAAQRKMYLHSAHHQDAADPMTPQRAAEARQQATQILAGSRDFSDMDLTGADLSGMDLSGACFRGALLESANLRGARLDNADFSRAVLVRACLDGTSLRETLLEGANLGFAQCRQTVFAAANLRHAMLENILCEDCDFSASLWEDNTVVEASFARCSFRRASLKVVMFLEKVHLDQLDFEEATLFKLHFVRCKPGAIGFAGARLESCVFVDVQADGCVDFTRAKLRTTCVVGTSSFRQAKFAAAHLRECSLRAVALSGACLADARLDNSDFSGCDLTRADFSRSNARDSRFVRANLQHASLRDADLIDASFQKADLRLADLRGANLFRADVSQSLMDGSTLLDGAYTHLAKVYPVRQDAAAA